MEELASSFDGGDRGQKLSSDVSKSPTYEFEADSSQEDDDEEVDDIDLKAFSSSEDEGGG